MYRLKPVIGLLVLGCCCSDAAAWHWRHRTAECCSANSSEPICTPKLQFPMYCLQEKWAEYGTNDLYVSLTEYGPHCSDDHEEEFWYGNPPGHPPQACDRGNCQGDTHGDPLPGHGMTLSERDAWDQVKRVLASGISTSGEHKFYLIPKNPAAGITQDLYFIAIPVKISSGTMEDRVRYFGFETQAVASAVKPTLISAKQGPGSQLKLHAKDEANQLTILVWRQ